MTREEAIAELRKDKSLYESDVCHADDGSPDGRLIKALDMAIESLSANYTTKKPNDVVEQKNDVVAEPTDLISRADAIEAVRKKLQDWGGYAFEEHREGLYEAIDVLESLPSADRPSGEWVIVNHGLDIYICDQCGEVEQIQRIPIWDYCPNCGAKMRNKKGGSK